MTNQSYNLNSIQEILSHLPLHNVEYFETIGSTNDRAAEIAANNNDLFSVVIADEQTKGRGRSGRSWFTPPGSALALSIVLPINANKNNSEIALVSGLGALAVTNSINNKLNLDAKIKWPNDVLVSGEKVSGVLAEAHWVGDSLKAVILGIGVNIGKESIPPSETLTFPANSLNNITGRKIKRLEILRDIIQNGIALWPLVGSREFINTWENGLAFSGESVKLISGKNIAIYGIIEGHADDGSLLLRLENGKLKNFQVGEIQLRPNIDKN